MTGSLALDGVHHLKFAVADLDDSLRWWEKVFSAQRQPDLDHTTREGELFAYILFVPGLDMPVQLRFDTAGARSTAGLDPASFAVPTERELHEWAARLDDLGIDHSPVLRGFTGWLLVVRNPDGLSIRLHSRETHDWDPANVEYDSVWVTPPDAPSVGSGS